MAVKLDVLSVGNANVDLMVNNDRIVDNSDFKVMPGGSACNFAVGCARLGLKSGFLGFLSKGYFSRFILDNFSKEGVKSLAKIIPNQPTGIIVVFTKKYFKKYIKYNGVNSLIETLNLKPYFSRARHLHLATPPLSLLKQLPSDDSLSVSVDPGATISRYSLKELSPYLSRITVFLPNEREAKLITGHGYKRAAREFLDAGVKIVIIKLGSKGAYLKTRSEESYVKSINLPVVDTTGAGDAFDSAFITAWLSGKSLLEACRWGVISGNVCVTSLGAQSGIKSLSELKRLYEKYY